MVNKFKIGDEIFIIGDYKGSPDSILDCKNKEYLVQFSDGAKAWLPVNPIDKYFAKYTKIMRILYVSKI